MFFCDNFNQKKRVIMQRPLLVFIPARIGSTRFPQKPLQLLYNGQTILQACFSSASKSKKAGLVCIVTADAALAEHAKANKLNCLYLPFSHALNGTERVGLAVEALNIAENAIICNVQGDIIGEIGSVIDQMYRAYIKTDRRKKFVLTPVMPLHHSEYADRNIVKCRARDGIFMRGVPESPQSEWYYHHGIYMATAGLFFEYINTPPTAAEKEQQLEQLRWNIPIYTFFFQKKGLLRSINTAQDLEYYNSRFAKKAGRQKTKPEPSKIWYNGACGEGYYT